MSHKINKLYVCLILIALNISGCSKLTDGNGQIRNDQSTEFLTQDQQHLAIDTKEIRDIPLGSPVMAIGIGLEDYKCYGQFLNGRVLDVYFLYHPNVKVYGIHPDRVILYFVDGLLVKKKYNFENDIFNELLEHIKLKDNPSPSVLNSKSLTIRFKSKMLKYSRGSEFSLVERLHPNRVQL